MIDLCHNNRVKETILHRFHLVIMEYLSEMLLFSFPIEYIQILNRVHNSPSEKQCCLKMPLLCFDSMHIPSEKRNVNRCATQCVSRKRGSQKQPQRSAEPGWQAGRPPGSPGQLSCGGSSLFLVKSRAFLQEQRVMVEYGACLVIPD